MELKDLLENMPECTVFLLAKAYQKAHGDFKKRLLPYNLTNLQHVVLEGLWYREGVTAKELGNMLILDKATLSGVLERMDAGGWIKKIPDPEDRRVHRIYLTQKANEMKEELVNLRIQNEADLLSGFTMEEKILLKRLLKDLIDNPG